MRPTRLILTYHAIAPGPPPLFVAPGVLERHLDCIVDSGAAVLTVSALAAALGDGTLPDLAVALTFDDGFESVVTDAAPLFADRGLVATIFCVSDHVGGTSDWPSQPSSAPRLPLADTEALRELATTGWEIGAHAVSHQALADEPAEVVRRDLLESRCLLEETVGTPVTSFAWPYGSVPDNSATLLGEAGYHAACTTRIATVDLGTLPLQLPRVDAHYLRSPPRLAALLRGRLPGYLATRRALAAARRRVISDHARPESRA